MRYTWATPTFHRLEKEVDTEDGQGGIARKKRDNDIKMWVPAIKEEKHLKVACSNLAK